MKMQLLWLAVLVLFPLEKVRSLEPLEKPVAILANFDVADFGVFEKSLEKEGVFLFIISDRKEMAKFFVQPSLARKIIVFGQLVDRDFALQVPQKMLVYFLWEPWTLSKDHFEPYEKVYTWNDDLVDGKKFFKCYYPNLQPMTEQLVPFEQKKLCVMVAGSDLDPVDRQEDLYSERMRMVEFFETKPAGEFSLYGRDWKKRSYRDYKGPIPGFHSGEEKKQVLKQYRFSICFENTKAKGYITEKIFGCFAAGCVPIYCGAPNIEKYIPKGCYVDYRDFSNKEALYEYIKSMSKNEYESYLKNIRAFLVSDQAKVFTVEHLKKTLLEAICDAK